MSRAGRGLTGVDRVELAYLEAGLAGPVPLFALARTAFGFVLLDEAGAARFRDRLRSGEWGAPDMLSQLARRLTPAQRAAQTAVRRLARARCRRSDLGRMLGAHLPAGTSYLNIGHSSFDAVTLDGVRRVPGARVAVFVHDTIPLDYPQFQRVGAEDRFRRFMAMVPTADAILTSSEAVAGDIRRHLGRAVGPPVTVAPLGVEVARPDPGALPFRPSAPYFVALGTIEPRKNIGFLLTLWESLDVPPALYLCGARGWNNEAVFRKLDRGVAGVTELPGLGDGAVASLIQGARALLFPSLAEGYGLPPLEAAAKGTPVVCAPSRVASEVLGDLPIYLGPGDLYGWQATIRQLTEQPVRPRPVSITPPSWADHFRIAFEVA